MALNIRPINNQYSLRVPAHRFHQGGREVYYFALDFETLDGLLPQRVDDSMVRDANRRLTPSHARNIQRYLAEKDDWLLGALMLGIALDALEFKPYLNEQGESDNPNFGELCIRANRANTMRIFDGQHRRRAIQDVLDELSNADRRADKLESLRKASMTVVLYAEDDIKTLRQMFVDASKTKRIESNTVTRFDQRDAFNRVAVWLADNSRVFKGRVEMERSSVATSSQHLLAINQLATILKSLAVGYGKRVSRDLNEDYMQMQNFDGLCNSCRVWSDQFMPATREEYSGFLSGEIDNPEIPKLRAITFAYNVTFVRVLAGCYHLWMNEYDSWKPLAEFIRKASIGRKSEHGLLVDARLVNPNGTLFSRRQEMAGAIDYIVNAAKKDM